MWYWIIIGVLYTLICLGAEATAKANGTTPSIPKTILSPIALVLMLAIGTVYIIFAGIWYLLSGDRCIKHLSKLTNRKVKQ